MSTVGFNSSIWPWVRKVGTTSLVSGIWPAVLNPTGFSSNVKGIRAGFFTLLIHRQYISMLWLRPKY